MNLGGSERGEESVLGGSAHVVTRIRQRGRGPYEPAGRIAEDLLRSRRGTCASFPSSTADPHRCPYRPSRCEAAFPQGSRTLAASDVDRLIKGRCERGESLDTFANVAIHGGAADPEPGGQIGVGLAFPQVGQHKQRLAAGFQPHNQQVGKGSL